MSRYLVLALATTCIGVAPLAAAETTGCTNASATVSQDVEGGGVLNAVAHRAGAAKRFELMDSNHDGKVTAAEIGGSRGAESIAWASRMTSPSEKLSQLDTNKDGVLTPKEYADGSQRAFNTLDVDGNGILSDAEMLAPAGARRR